MREPTVERTDGGGVSVTQPPKLQPLQPRDSAVVPYISALRDARPRARSSHISGSIQLGICPSIHGTHVRVYQVRLGCDGKTKIRRGTSLDERPSRYHVQ